ncbi:SAM-dependent methyltransferase [Geomicrobium sp. JCM 19055]|uniref:SAM-dependent methyltransferase n=1 Tax=Geomicrobium sp. JCM 19055 TaxID=1460649 RepID=UPI001268A474|nr:SAM-dependent methyltransferase [Geomicrobium sp. JCM 19055]
MMHVEQLSERLRFIALNTPRNTTVADIGTDHAQLPVALALDGLIKKSSSKRCKWWTIPKCTSKCEQSSVNRTD